MLQYERFKLPQRAIGILIAAISFSLLNSCSTSKKWLNVPHAKSMAIICFYENQDIAPLTFVITNAKQRVEIVKSLNDLRWTQPGTPLAEIGMIRPDIDILVTDDVGKSHTYQLYWTNHSLVDQDSALLLRVTDISQLRAQVTTITGLSSWPKQPDA
ncbi:hypothetical protein N9D23_00425 [Rubripirellula sp.]|nr:hypothetical protein [Rubripirellula sp.]